MEHLIPDSLFEGLSTPVLAVIAGVALFVLAKGADQIVEAATALALRMGLPKVVIGATILSLGTTAPECAVSVMAAIDGDSGVSLGNAVGSVIYDTAIIFGLLSLLAPLPADKFILSRQGWVQFGSAVLLAGFCYFMYAAQGETAVIPRWFGFVLLGLLAAYLAISVRWARQHPSQHPQAPAAADTDAEASKSDAPPLDADTESPQHFSPAEATHAVDHDVDAHDSGRPVWMLLLILAAALLVVLVSGRCAIGPVVEVAGRIGVPEVVIAAVFVALGTSLPELIVGWKAVRSGNGEILVGNVIGADVLNILFVVGASAACVPLPFEKVFLTVHLPTMLLSLIYFRFCIFKATRTGSFTTWMGIPLLVMYVAYVVLQFTVTKTGPTNEAVGQAEERAAADRSVQRGFEGVLVMSGRPGLGINDDHVEPIGPVIPTVPGDPHRRRPRDLSLFC